ncbi:hypothetical protein G9A89_012252 [Geosiphon pyriformis]|nr:hypothetical protein G9A89_012252 [Geosiphon pyriformis]
MSIIDDTDIVKRDGEHPVNDPISSRGSSRGNDTSASNSQTTSQGTDHSSDHELMNPEPSGGEGSSGTNSTRNSPEATNGIRTQRGSAVVKSISDILNAENKSPLIRDAETDQERKRGNSQTLLVTPMEIEEGKVLPSEDKASIQAANMQHIDSSVSVRDYLDQMVVPNLLEGMRILVNERPSNPCLFLGRYLIDNCQHDHSQETPVKEEEEEDEDEEDEDEEEEEEEEEEEKEVQENDET